MIFSSNVEEEVEQIDLLLYPPAPAPSKNNTSIRAKVDRVMRFVRSDFQDVVQ
jgi:hypothetical protein